MPYRLPSTISYGIIDAGAVVLDLASDRYLRLGREQAAALRALRDDGCGHDHHAAIQTLLARGLLVEGQGSVGPVAAETVRSSALEFSRESTLPADAGRGPPSAEILLARYAAARSMGWAGLASTIRRWRQFRAHGVDRNRASGALVELVKRYHHGLRYYPAKRRCVPDSLGLMRCLWRRGHDADLYFGVRLDPFAAHCWVQAGDLLLTDPLDSVAEFTPVFRL